VRGSKRGWWILLLVLLAVVVIGRLAAPAIVKKVVTKSLHELPDGYIGNIDDVDLRVLSAEVALLGLRIEKTNGLIPVPFMQAKELVIGTVMDSWKPRTTLHVQEPNMSYVDGPNEARSQKGPTFDLENLHKQLPFELVRVTIADGQAHFRNYQTKPDLDVFATGLDVLWDDLFGCLPPGSSACHSTLRGDAKVLKTGKLNLRGKFERDPAAHLHADISIRDLKAVQLSPALKEYAKIDFQKGDIDLDARYDKTGKSQSALIVPKLTDIEVVGGDKENTSTFRELGAAAAAGWFERKKGTKAIKFSKKPSGGSSFELVDVPRKSADSDSQDD
jgi:hypothetical protein